MKALHRILFTGTIGGLAALTVASSGAFACTALATVSIYGAGTKIAPLTVKAGEAVDVEISRFNTTGDFSKVRLFIDQPTAGVQSDVTLLEGPGAGFSWVVPPLEKSTTPYNLVAVQTDPSGEIVGRASQAFTVWEGPLPPRQPAGSFPTTPPPGPQPTLPPPAPAQPDRQPVPTEQVTLPAGTARDMISSTETPRAATGALPALTASTSAEPAAATLRIEGGTLPPEKQETPVATGQPQVPADSLWSGLDGGGPPASLLDAGSPPPRSDGLLGGALLGAGTAVLALAGLGLGLSRRRLALVRR
jgi:hypothetical protein